MNPCFRAIGSRLAGHWARLALLTLLFAGCDGGGPTIVPVRGKITFNGGPWPHPGGLFLLPVQAASNEPLAPGFANFDVNGNFVAECNSGEGLVPGKYQVAVQCWTLPPDDTRPDNPKGISCVPDKYRNSATSGLEFTVDPGQRGHLELSFDVPK